MVIERVHGRIRFVPSMDERELADTLQVIAAAFVVAIWYIALAR
jgi:hypothetical protein